MAATAILKNRKKINMFATDWPIWTKFGMLMRLDLSAAIANKISLFQKIHGGNGHFENSKNCNISTTIRPILTTFSTLMSLCLPDSVCQWSFTNLKIQDGGVHHFEKFKNLSIFATNWPILPKFDILMSILWTPLAKNLVILKMKDGGGCHFEN